MKKILFLSLLTAILLAGFSLDADAQYGRKKKKKKKKPAQDEYFDDRGNFTSNLWYGGGFNLGFGGTNGSNIFNFGLSPMAAYKIAEPFSVGLRAELDYYSEKVITPGDNFRYNAWSYGVGPFTRVKYWQLFFHGELMYQNIARPYDENNRGPFIDPDNPNRLLSFRYDDTQLNLGLGYTSNIGGEFAYEFYLLYDVLTELQDNDSPWDLRIGITYRF